ncbi:MAG: hypothetical protein IAF38_00825 [Bacteroidia bacterium]|nr:hypothetical protein [Bacteroidia bacterium]
MKKTLLIIVSAALIIISSCRKDVGKVQATDSVPCGTVSFAQEINPIITQKCLSCHTQSYVCGSLEDYGTVKTKVDNGTLVDKVEKKLMPPSNPLSDSEIQLIKCWVNDGAKNN